MHSKTAEKYASIPINYNGRLVTLGAALILWLNALAKLQEKNPKKIKKKS